MEVTMNWFLIITEGVIALVAVITLAIVFAKGAIKLENRITRLETQIEPFWDAMRKAIGSALLGIPPKGNPVTPERWQYLANRLQLNALSTAEAEELNNAMIERQAEAQRNNDTAALLILGLGLALLAVLLAKK
jgi:uncharacterized coiled-coil protein SlyX